MAKITFQESLGLVQAALSAGNLPRARSLLEALAAIAPNHASVVDRLGAVVFQQGEIARAITLFKRAGALAPGRTDYHINLGVSLLHCDQDIESSLALERAWALRPTEAGLLRQLADAMAEAGRWERATHVYWRLLGQEPADAEAHCGLGIALAEIERMESAAVALRRALDLAPGDIRQIRAFAELLRRTGAVDEAVHVLRQAIGASPERIELPKLLADILDKAGRNDEAAEVLSDALRLDGGKSGTGRMLSALRQQQGDLVGALAAIEAELNEPEVSPALLDFGARLNVALGQLQQATVHLRKLAARHADPYQRALTAAFAEFCAGNYEKADAGFVAATDILTPVVDENYRLSLGDTCRFSRGFYDALRASYPAEPVAFAPIIDANVSTRGRYALVVTVDANYLARYRAVIMANAQRVRSSVFHLHVIDPTDLEELRLLAQTLGCMITYEQPNAGAWRRAHRTEYYAVVRLIRAQQFMDHFDYAGLCTLDVDTYWSNEIDGMFDLFAHADVAVLDDKVAPPWIRHNASLIFLRNAPEARRLLEFIARYVGYFVDRGQTRWRLDQCALFCSFFMLQTHENRPVRYVDATPALERHIRIFKKAEDEAFIGTAHTRLGSSGIDMLAELGRLRHVRRRFEEAESLYRQAVALAPQRADLAVSLARTLSVLGRLDEAEAMLVTVPDDHAGAHAVREEIELRRVHDLAEALSQQGKTAPSQAQTAVVGSTEDGLLSLLVARIGSTQLETRPFAHFVIDRLIPDDVYDALVRAIAAHTGWSWGTAAHYPERASADVKTLADEAGRPDLATALSSPRLVHAIIDALGASAMAALYAARGVTLSASVKITRDRRHYALGPHRDHVIRFGSLLIYLARPGQSAALGTSLYRPRHSVPYLDHGQHRSFDEFERVSTVPFRPNTAFGFLNMGEAYHGVESVVTDDLRDLIQLTIYARVSGGNVLSPDD